MTTENQRRANRLNALKATGPRSKKGKILASANAMTHGLSVALPSSLITAEKEQIAALIAADGMDLPSAQLLASHIIEFERNLRYQRKLYCEEVSGDLHDDVWSEERNLAMARMVEESLLEIDPGSISPKLFKTVAALGRSFQRRANLGARLASDRRHKALRYLKRAGNQLIKQLRQYR